jgi:hypothetical protein
VDRSSRVYRLLSMKAVCMTAPRVGEHAVSIVERLTRVLRRKGRLPHHRIEIRLHNLNQLFNSIDPSPFHEKDLDRDAEEFIVGWVQEFHRHDPVTLVIHVKEPPGGVDPRRDVEKAVHNYFAYRAKLNHLDFKHMMKQARVSLAAGLTFLTMCIFAGNLISKWATEPWSLLLREAMLIGGWVAMWRPMQTYLYDWWPLRRRGQIFQKMSRMRVDLKLSQDVRRDSGITGPSRRAKDPPERSAVDSQWSRAQFPQVLHASETPDAR